MRFRFVSDKNPSNDSKQKKMKDENFIIVEILIK